MENIYKKYAELLVKYSLYLEAGERLLIKSTYLAEPLIAEVYRAALAAGAYPEIKIELNNLDFIKYSEGSVEQISNISPFETAAYSEFDAVLTIDAPFNSASLRKIIPAKKRMAAEARSSIRRSFMERAAKGEAKWTLCEFPTDSAAQECGMSLEEYSNFVFSACRLDEEDPVAAWLEVRASQQRIVNHLNKCSKIEYSSNDIDITFSTAGRIWINSDGTHNMPSGEVFTTPVEDSVNGHIRFSYPAIYMGVEVKDIELVVENGMVVNAKASVGEELLKEVLSIPGGNRFGEAAIGTNYGITEFTKNILFDEKKGGTIHMALGSCYKETGGKNESSIHWDMIADMTQSGEIIADGKVIYQKGEFLI